MTAPKLMTLTDAAAERIRALMSASGKDATGLRIGIKKGGCAGMEYTMSYAETKAPHDEVVEDKGVRILIDPSAVLFLLGTEMDYRTDRMSSGFVFNNPNQTIRLRLRQIRFAHAGSRDEPRSCPRQLGEAEPTETLGKSRPP